MGSVYDPLPWGHCPMVFVHSKNKNIWKHLVTKSWLWYTFIYFWSNLTVSEKSWNSNPWRKPSFFPTKILKFETLVQEVDWSLWRASSGNLGSHWYVARLQQTEIMSCFFSGVLNWVLWLFCLLFGSCFNVLFFLSSLVCWLQAPKCMFFPKASGSNTQRRLTLNCWSVRFFNSVFAVELVWNMWLSFGCRQSAILVVPCFSYDL